MITAVLHMLSASCCVCWYCTGQQPAVWFLVEVCGTHMGILYRRSASAAAVVSVWLVLISKPCCCSFLLAFLSALSGRGCAVLHQAVYYCAQHQ